MRSAVGALRIAICAGAAALYAVSALAVTGVVTDRAGKPLRGVRVCHYQTSTTLEQLCGETDDAGRFTVLDSNEMMLRISTPGYFPVILEASGHHEIKLEQSPTLRVRMVDADTGEPLEQGEVYVVYPSAKRKGPFPVNRNGVRIARVLPPGGVRVIGRATGFEDSEPIAVELERGKETEATLKLKARPKGD